MGKKGRDIKKALQEVACCCSLAGDFYLSLGLLVKFCLIDCYYWVTLSFSFVELPVSFVQSSVDASKLIGVKIGLPWSL